MLTSAARLARLIRPHTAIPYCPTAHAAPAPRTRISIRSLLLNTALLFTVLLTLGGFLFHAYATWKLARPPVAPVSSNPMLAAGLPYEDIQFPSRNQRSVLEGWYLTADGSDRTIIFSHGYGGNREEPWVSFYDLASSAVQAGYNVIMFDYGYVSNRYFMTGGRQEAQELWGAVDWAKARGAEQVYIWGFSMGAGTALKTALLSPDIDGMVLDSTFLLTADTLHFNLQQQMPSIPKLSSRILLNGFFPVLQGFSLPTAHAASGVQYEMPLFFIHGGRDNKAPHTSVTAFYDTLDDQPLNRLWLVPNGRHELIYRANKQEYLAQVFAFLQEASEAR